MKSACPFSFNDEIEMYKNIAYFKGLNALRFFAASLVVLHHTATIGKKERRVVRFV